MDYSKMSGIFWIITGVILCISGMISIFHRSYAEGLGPLLLGVLILVFQFYVYRKTGTIKGGL